MRALGRTWEWTSVNADDNAETSWTALYEAKDVQTAVEVQVENS